MSYLVQFTKLLISVILVTSFTGCTDTNMPPQPAPESQLQPEPEPEPEPKPGEKPAPAPSPEPHNGDQSPMALGLPALPIREVNKIPELPMLQIKLKKYADMSYLGAELQDEIRKWRDEDGGEPTDLLYLNEGYTGKVVKGEFGGAPRRFAESSFYGWESAGMFDLYFQLAQNPSSESFLEAAISYLLVGRFDSALETIKKGKQKGDHLELLDKFAEHAQHVKDALTDAQNALRKNGLDITYPDEAIFIQALGNADGKSRYLILNLADAYVAAHPDSLTAIRCLAEANLTIYESTAAESSPLTDANDVPSTRLTAAEWRGNEALTRYLKLEPNNPFPPIRMIQHMRTPGCWRDIPPSMFLIDDAEANGKYGKETLAHMKFGLAVYWLGHEHGWGNGPLTNDCLDLIDQASDLAPNVNEFRELREHVEKNKAQIDRDMENIYKLRQQRSYARAQDAFSQSQGNLRRLEVERAMYDSINGIFQVSIDEVRKKNPTLGELFNRCVYCYGSGKKIWQDGHTMCPACLGSGLPPGR